MKISLKLPTIALLLTIQLSAQQQAPASIEGIVTRQGSTDAVPKATVELRRGTDTTGYSTITDEGGRFSIVGIPPGEYRVFSYCPGFVTAEIGQRQAGGPGQPLTLRSGQRTTGMQIGLTAGGVISGRITDRGQPSANTPVNAVKITYELGHPVQQALIAARTDDRGEYRIFWLPPGRYYVWAGPLDYEVDANLRFGGTGNYSPILAVSAPGRYVFSTRSLHPDTQSTERHVLTYYGDTTDLRKAVPIDVGAGREARGIDIQADAKPALHVRGTVTGMPESAPGQTVRATVLLLPGDPSSFISLPSVQSEPNGAFEMDHVSPGSYIIYATAGNLQSRIPIDLQDRDLNGVNVALKTGLTLSGRLVVETPNEEVRSEVSTALRVGLMTDPVLGGFLIRSYTAASVTGPVSTSPGGTFSIPGSSALEAGPLPGKYRVYVPPLLVPASGWSAPRASLPAPMTTTAIPPALEGTYVKAIRLGDRDVLNDGMEVFQNPREPLTIVIGTDAATVGGVVNDSGQKTVASATVVLIPENGLKFQTNHRYTSTDASGRFQLQNIAPGDYRIFAWEYAEAGAWQNPEFVRNHESQGQRIRIPAGMTTTLSLTSERP